MLKPYSIMTAIFLIGACASGVSSQNKVSSKLESHMKRDIAFERDNLRLAGNLYFPKDFDEKKQYTAVIVQGSLSSVKEQMGSAYAKRLAGEGFIALTFDYSHYGSSEGQPRQLESPDEKLKDLQAAVTYLSKQSYVKGVSALGVCTSAGNVAYLAVADKRLKAVATVAAYLGDPTFLKSTLTEAGVAKRIEDGRKARAKFEKTGKADEIKVYSENDEPAVNYGKPGSYDYYLNSKRGGVAEWKNQFAVQSWEDWINFDGLSKASQITIPTMMVHSDQSAFPASAKKFYTELKGPKEIVWSDGGHYDYYDSPKHIDNAVSNIVRFFKAHSN